jgi:lipoprotein-anchoring transpeptidase ErfK/SrfK
MTISRRKFLKLSGLSAAAALTPRAIFPPPPEEAPRPIQLLGRATRTLAVYERPDPQSAQRGYIRADAVFRVYDAVLSQEERPNHTWYRVQRGYVFSGYVQTVRWQLQTPTLDVPNADPGFLGEVTVPYTSARAWYTTQAAAVYRLYYGTTYWVGDAKADDAGAIWYKINGERDPKHYWVQGAHIRRVAPEELTPLSPTVSDKRIEVDLAKQTFRCYENGTLVLDTLCSTGIYLRTENNRRIYGTPAGEWAITRKRASRHMAGDDAASTDFFDLPGVPWVSYFHWWGTAIHGTYWHNDFGTPHSHGCINLPSETAKWVFRWTQPQAKWENQTIAEGGTPMIVI